VVPRWVSMQPLLLVPTNEMPVPDGFLAIPAVCTTHFRFPGGQFPLLTTLVVPLPCWLSLN
jgi:hypothetical protein